MSLKNELTKFEFQDANFPILSSPSVANYLNPLETIAQSYARTLMYKAEIKRLDNELQRMDHEASIIHKRIDSELQVQLEKLTIRRSELCAFYTTFNNELKNKHIQRQTILSMAEDAKDACLRPNISMEERALFRELTLDLMRQLRLINDDANISLDKLIKTLPNVDHILIGE